jgi:K319L-like, PKD domain
MLRFQAIITATGETARRPLALLLGSRRAILTKKFAVALAGLGAMVLSLSGCQLFFPLKTFDIATNYYVCDLKCSRRVTADHGATVFSLPAGSVLYDVPAGSIGAILDGPVEANSLTWWQVQFDGQQPLPTGQGWVRQDLLTVANETLVGKKAQACLPPQFNPFLGGTTAPTFDDLQALCGGDAAVEAQAALDEKLAPLGRFLCQGSPQPALDRNYDASCEDPCPDGKDVCLVAGSDPPDPIPDPLSAALFQPTSVCEVTGQIQLSVQGHQPKTQPAAQGVLEIRGRACPPAEGCRVTMSYRLTGDDITFDSGSIFASDPKFVDLSLSGATEPDAINLGQLLPDFYLGEVPAETAFSSGHVKRKGSTYIVAGRNSEGLALAMNWTNKACAIGGQLVGQVEGDEDEGALDAQVEVALQGTIVNQPPWPNAGSDQTVECTSRTGASVTLDGSGSTDPDNNISFYVWRRGSAAASPLTTPSANPVAQTVQPLGEETYYLQVVDSGFAADEDFVKVSVVDTTAPTISCNAPETMSPPDVPENPQRGAVSFKATATDACSGASSATITGFTCTVGQSCKATIAGDTITIMNSGGVGNRILWTVSAQDSTGNVGQTTCHVDVIKKK